MSELGVVRSRTKRGFVPDREEQLSASQSSQYGSMAERNGGHSLSGWYHRVLSERRSRRAVAVGSGPADHLELLDGGEQAYPRMLDAIARAKSHVYLEVYSFASAGVGARFIAAFSEAASRGVDVRIVIDGWGSALSGRSIANTLRAAGCHVRIYHRLSALFRGRFARTHRKILLIDDRVAFVGGFNIGDENLTSGKRPAWADLALQIEGPHCLWLGRLYRREKVIPINNGLLIDVSGLGGGFRLRMRYITAFREARHRIQLAHAYFLPDRSLVRYIVAAARRGVEVNLVLPGQSDVPLVRAATRSLYRRLLRAGVHIYEWSGSVLHAKVASVDGNRLLMGSFNLDPFSLVNREILVQVSDPTIIEQGEAWIDRLLQNSRAVSVVEVESCLRRWVVDPLGVAIAVIARMLGRLLARRMGRGPGLQR